MVGLLPASSRGTGLSKAHMFPQCCRDCIVLYAEPTRKADFCQSPEDVCTCLQKMSRPLAGSLKPQTLFDCEVLHPGIRPEAPQALARDLSGFAGRFRLFSTDPTMLTRIIFSTVSIRMGMI